VVLRFVEAIVLQHFPELKDLPALGHDDVARQAPDGGVAGFPERIVGHDQRAAVVRQHPLEEPGHPVVPRRGGAHHLHALNLGGAHAGKVVPHRKGPLHQPLQHHQQRRRAAWIQRSLELFQQRVSRITPTYIELIDIWKSRPEALDAVVMAEQSYRQLVREPGFEDLLAAPFGADQGSPLVAFPWTTGAEREALERFARFTASAPLQTLARRQDFGDPTTVPARARPPRAEGELLSKLQQLWKQRKDGGRTVYLQLLVDLSGSMNEDGRLSQLKRALIVASGAINSGNHVGLISFGDQPSRLLPLQPYDAISRGRLLATVQELQADGATALYDGLAVALHDLMEARRRDPNGRFHLLVLSDGLANKGLGLEDLRDVIEHSGITITPIAYGEMNDGGLRDIAAIRESTVYRGDPKSILPLIHDLFQTTL
jgi:Ca-activated chloride channel family protein